MNNQNDNGSNNLQRIQEIIGQQQNSQLSEAETIELQELMLEEMGSLRNAIEYSSDIFSFVFQDRNIAERVLNLNIETQNFGEPLDVPLEQLVPPNTPNFSFLNTLVQNVDLNDLIQPENTGGLLRDVFSLVETANPMMDADFMTREQLEEFMKPHIVTLTKEQYNQLESIAWSKDVTEDPCTICFDQFEEGEIIMNLGCNHYYHNDCISQWLLNESVFCPMCKIDCREALQQAPPEKTS